MAKHPRVLIGTGIGLVVAGSVATFTPVTKAVAAGSPITFGVPSVVDPIHGVGEPDIGVSRAGGVFVSGPAGTGEQRSLWWSSVDGGQTYRVIEPIAEAANPVVSTPNLPGGGDTDIAFDNQTPQKQYFSDLTALTSIRQVTTSNEGASETQTQNVPATGEVDRQWFAVWDPPTGVTTTSPVTTRPLIYEEYNGVVWERSTDGLNYVQASPNSPFGPDGYPSIDQVTGKVFQANYSGTTVKLNIGTPNDAAGDLSFLDDTSSANLITVATGVANSGDTANFVATSMDSARNLYVVWVGRSNAPATLRQTFVAAAPANNAVAVSGCLVNCWNNFTTVQVSDGSQATGDAVNVFPWIKAGGPGMADAVWYGDSSTLSPSATCTPLAAGCHVWNVFMNEVVFPTDSNGAVIPTAAPTTNLVKATPHPMDYLDVCLSGTGCVTSQGNRNLADFFEVNIDHTGAAEIVYDDMSNNLIQAGTSNALDHAGLPLPTVIRQNGGPGLLGSDVSGASTSPISAQADVSGDALFPVVGGSNVPAMDLTNVSLSLSGGTLTATLKVANLNLLSSVPTTITGDTLQQFLVRWQMGNTLYYAEATLAGSTTGAQFSAGKTNSVDLCSVSACRPLVAVYGETPDPAAGQTSETGSVTCPGSPSAANPCTITITVNSADVGSPSSTSLLEEVGGYAYASSHPQTGTTNTEGEIDSVPLEIDGICCYNFSATQLSADVPESPWTVLMVGIGGALVAAGVVQSRRRRGKSSNRSL